MSRVAKAPVEVPTNVELKIENGEVSVKGPKGTLTQKINKLVSITKSKTDDNQYVFSPATVHPNAWAQAGTARALISNMVRGVTQGFTLTLELVGVGYRAQSKGKSVSLSLGFSHPVDFMLPAGVEAETPSPTVLVLNSIDKQLLGQAAAEIRSLRPPEPYKGKGIKYAGEEIARKEAKKK